MTKEFFEKIYEAAATEAKNCGAEYCEVYYAGAESISANTFRDELAGFSADCDGSLIVRVSVGGSVLYDGLMAEMPAAVDTLLPAGSDTLDYQLTAYLDTSVGNPYMYQQLVADFYWWVADSEELAPPTGDTMQPLLWGAAVLVSGAALTVLLRRRREVSHD